MGDRPCQSQVKAKEGYPVSPREHGVQLEGGGAGSPTAGSCGTPSLLALTPRCTISYPPTPYLSRACPSSQVLEFPMLSPLAVPRAPPPQTFYYLLGLWKKTFFSWDPTFFFTLAPCLSLMQLCHLGGHGWGRRGFPYPE